MTKQTQVRSTEEAPARSALKLALEALNSFPTKHLTPFISSARTAIREALAEPSEALAEHPAIKQDLTPEQPAQQEQESDHEFKNFHRSLCERFGYVHDEKDWKRDLVSLEEWIAKKVQPQQEPVAWMTQARNFVHLCEFTEEEAKLYGWSAVYTSPPTLSLAPAPEERKRQARSADTGVHATAWRGLTDEEIDTLREANSEGRGAGWRFNFKGFARAIEAKLKEKNED